VEGTEKPAASWVGVAPTVKRNWCEGCGSSTDRAFASKSEAPSLIPSTTKSQCESQVSS
jgi:hypothetical protein